MNKSEALNAPSTGLDHLVLAFLAFILGLSATALTTARMGMFSVGASLAVAFALAAYTFIWSRRHIALSHTGPKAGWIIAIALVSGFSSGYLATSDMWGGRDPGVYMEITGNIAIQDTTDFDRPALRSGFENHNEILTNYPGVYMHKHKAHKKGHWVLVSQFNDMTPATRAVFVKAFGYPGYAIAIGFFAFSLLVFVGLTARKMGGTMMTGALSVVLLSLSAPFVYASRTNLSEPPTILYAFGFIYLAMLFQSKPESKFISFLMVGFLGLVFFSRPDGVLFGLLLSAFVFYMAIQKPETLTRLVGITIGAWVMAFLGFWDLSQHSGPYFYDLTTTDRGLDRVIIFVGAISVVALAAGATLPRLPQHKLPIVGKFLRNATVWIGLTSIAVAITYFSVRYVSAQFIDLEEVAKIGGRERVFAFQDRLAHELSWYLPLVFLALTAWGAIKLSRTDKSSWVSAFIVFSMFCTVLFVYRNMIYPDHMWATRRWLTFIIVPSCILASIAAVDLLNRKHIVATAAAVIAIGMYSYSNIRIAGDWMFAPSQREWKAEYDKMAEAIIESEAEHAFVSPNAAAGILAFQYGLPVLPVKTNIEAGLRTVYENKQVCTPALQRWNGYDHYRSGGMAGRFYTRCFAATVSIPGTKFGQRVGGISIPQGAKLTTLGFNQGWQTHEGWGVWSRHDKGKILLPLDTPKVESEIASGNDLTLDINMRALVGGTLKEQPVIIEVNGEALWEGIFTSLSLRSIEIPLSNEMLSRQEALDIAFLPQVLTTPEEIGINSDARPLGVGIASVTLNKAVPRQTELIEQTECSKRLNLEPDRCLDFPALAQAGFQTLAGKFNKRGVVTTGTAGYLLYGPYHRLAAGDYVARIDATFSGSDTITIDIASDRGTTKHEELKIVANDLGSEGIVMPFTLAHNVNDIEIRVQVSANVKGEIRSINVEPAN